MRTSLRQGCNESLIIPRVGTNRWPTLCWQVDCRCKIVDYRFRIGFKPNDLIKNKSGDLFTIVSIVESGEVIIAPIDNKGEVNKHRNDHYCNSGELRRRLRHG